jgi:multiple sugar transport system ATP-binding protein
MSSIRLSGVGKVFGKTRVIEGLDLELREGEFTVLVGPSGCGKTTTLRMIAGLEETSSGSIHIGDTDVTKLQPRERDVAMVFQNYALYPHLTVEKNIAFPLEARGMPAAAARARAREVATSLGLEALCARKPSELSGGQQQRVAIGRAIAREPQVFLFDEPLSNLDAKLRVEMRTEILRLQRQSGTTAVYVTHDQEEAMTLSDRMVVMKDGVVVQQGPPAALYAEPVDVFVAQFIGSPQMNLVDGIVSGEVFTADDGGWHLPMADVADGRHRLGIRPEDLLVGVAEGETLTSLYVEFVELLGPRAIVTLRAPHGRMTAVVEAADLESVKEGATVTVGVRPHGLHLFDAASGARVTTT